MPVEPVFETKISRVSILDEHGVFDKELGEGLIPDDDLVGSRVFPPFQGSNGGPSGGPIMALAGEEIDAFVVPLGVRPGTILEVGDSFSFSAQMAPTLPAAAEIKITGPGGFSQTITG